MLSKESKRRTPVFSTTPGVSGNIMFEGHVETLRNGVSINGADVSEIYSPPRVVHIAERVGMVGGSSMDITTKNTGGEVWDFSRGCMMQPAWTRVEQERQLVLIVSVMCTNWSTVRKLNWKRMPMGKRESWPSPSQWLHLLDTSSCIESLSCSGTSLLLS